MVTAIIATSEPYDRPLAFATTHSNPSGAFQVSLNHRSEAMVSIAGGGRANILCAACKNGYQITYFDCEGKESVILKPFSQGRAPSDGIEGKPMSMWGNADTFIESLLSECELPKINGNPK